ncbi:RagB/SusD family nutrient uptake outer membrane protein [Mycovorax composti]|uniref:RagB/SusD family nutrient uptake outer membrane protein n=1 Tax=Mycovorax composti TaxID=2962693 RepID=UPI00391F372A
MQLGVDNICNLKFKVDLIATVANRGNDWPVIRHADIILASAEALIKHYDPNATSINLVNEVRAKAGITSLQLSACRVQNRSAMRYFKKECGSFMQKKCIGRI